MKLFNKSQVFLFDLIVASVILIVGFGLISQYFVSEGDNLNIYGMGFEFMSLLFTLDVNSNNEYKHLFIDGKITNIDNTMAQQIAEFYFLGESDELISNFSRDFITNYIIGKVNYNFTLIDDSGGVYELYSLNNQSDVSLDESMNAAKFSRTVLGFYNRTHYYGPYTITLDIWQ